MSTTTLTPAPVAVQKPAERPEVAALIPAALEALRARQLNTVEKRDESRTILDRRLDRDYSSNNDAARQANNNKVWADLAALDQSAKESDLTPERATRLRAIVARDLPRYFDYAAAVEIISDYEGDYHPDELKDLPKSPILDRVKKSAKERLEEISDTLSYAMNAEQVALVESLTGRGYEPRLLWRIHRAEGHARSILAIPLKAPYIRYEFAKLVERCRTQRELKLLAECYGLEAKATRGAEGTRIEIGTALVIAL
jgi:hypothetical protein